MGYSFPSDYWSLGVIIYQMAIGYLPFADDKEDPYEIFIATQKQKLVFPKSYTNKRIKKLIKLLLCKESWNRPDHTNIKTCGYFDEMTR
jgi:serine/threonine protein kinase